ncbi:MAG: LacI family DNA-binding transcriptional regulator [Bacillaceae bacterium]
MAVTIKDVAKKADVAPSTVSRVIADSPRISEKTKKKVRKVMDELGYHPNLIARSLANRSTKAIGIIMPSSASKAFQNPFFPEVIRGISSCAHTKEYSLYMSTGESEEEILEGVKKMVQGQRVDGIILLYSRLNDPVVSYLLELEFPFVLVGKPYKDNDKYTYVDNDNYGAAREVTNYLLSLGHKRIGFIGGNKRLLVTEDRFLGYQDALKLSDVPFCSDYVKFMDFNIESGRKAVFEMMSLEVKPTAIVVTDDILALGVLSYLDEIGINVPNDVSIISFNNLFLSEMSTPPLTTVDVNTYTLGSEATHSLIELIEKQRMTPKSIVVPYKLIHRGTCK